MKTRFTLTVTLTVLLCTHVPASASDPSFHLMQIEQVIGGVDGDASAQAIQLRMRSSFRSMPLIDTVKAFLGAYPSIRIASPALT